ncbi:hypothetical protein ACFS2C_05295 [Prauserella oleivorans]|uniref:Carboxymuconolactone decarboxylase family protein n=1 Tax=Prauserella oleivorans TaxID=1478153 RepID=A0ABW5W995_9PSEU
MSEHDLKSAPPKGTSADLQDQVLAAEMKLMSGERLTPKDQRLLAYTVFAGGCSSCAGQ